MQEYSTRALVIDVSRTGESDARITLYTELLGKVTVRARSLFKPKSKLAAHVQPLSLAQVRLVEKNGIQLVDAMTERRLIISSTPKQQAIELLTVARLINELTHSHQPDSELWEVIAGGKLMSRELLRVLGFDPDHARCQLCRKTGPEHFILLENTYLCSACMVRSRVRTGSAVEIPGTASVV